MNHAFKIHEVFKNRILIEIISIYESDELLWKDYYALSQEIQKRHYPDGYNPDLTFHEFQEVIGIGSAGSSISQRFLVSVNNINTGWFDCTEYEKTLYCMYDFIHDALNEQELKYILQKVQESTAEAECTHAELLTYRKVLIDYFNSVNAPVAEKILISRLKREDMNLSFYEHIVKHNAPEGLDLRYYNEIPGDIIDDFVRSVNECFDDRDQLSEIKNHYPPLTPAEWYKDKQQLSEAGTRLQMLVLFDKNQIAGFCWICVDSYRKDTIRHNGGLTAVNRGYRGRGLARFLKAKMYIKLLEENKDFKYITTDTMPWNTYMYNINREFGFKPFKNGCAFKLTEEFLKSYLNK